MLAAYLSFISQVVVCGSQTQKQRMELISIRHLEKTLGAAKLSYNKATNL